MKGCWVYYMVLNKEYIIEVNENNQKKYFCINRSFGEISYSLVDSIDNATKFDANQINYNFPFLRDKNYKPIKL